MVTYDFDVPHYLVLHGAFTNAGDHLIRDRAVDLFSRLRRDRRLLLRDRRVPLNPEDPGVADAAAIVLLGGPAWQRSTYPKIYPLTLDLDRIAPPIVPIGLGWRGESAGDASDFTFDSDTRRLLARVEHDGLWGTTRDTTTLSILSSHGLTRQLMSGCPSWYDSKSLGKQPDVSRVVRSIAYSVGARSSKDEVFSSFERDLVAALRSRYPAASIRAVFHHPISPVPGYPEHRAARHRALAAVLEVDGVEIVDASGSSESLINAYAHADLHVGLRVHAHLARCSKRQPSVLLAEDARAHVMCTGLGHIAFDAVDRNGGKAMPNRSVWTEVEGHLDACESAGWPHLSTLAGIIDATYPMITRAIMALP